MMSTATWPGTCRRIAAAAAVGARRARGGNRAPARPAEASTRRPTARRPGRTHLTTCAPPGCLRSTSTTRAPASSAISSTLWRRRLCSRWVLTRKASGALKASQGYEERGIHIRSVAPTGSADALIFAVAMSAQEGWICRTWDAQSADLQAEGISRLLRIRILRPPPGTKPNQVFYAHGSTYGTKDTGHAWYCHLRKYLETLGIVEGALEKAFYRFDPNGVPRTIINSHMDDLFVAHVEKSARMDDTEARMKRFLQFHGRATEFDSCGAHFQVTPSAIYRDQPKGVNSFEIMAVDASRTKDPDASTCDDGLPAFRPLNGQLQRVACHSRRTSRSRSIASRSAHRDCPSPVSSQQTPSRNKSGRRQASG